MSLGILFLTAFLKFNALLDQHKDWGSTKSHFREAYDNLIIMGPVTYVPGTITNIQELEDNNDSLGTLTDTMSSMQMANNANVQHIRSNVGALRQELAIMRIMLKANSAQLPVQAAPPQYAASPAPPFA